MHISEKRPKGIVGKSFTWFSNHIFHVQTINICLRQTYLWRLYHWFDFIAAYFLMSLKTPMICVFQAVKAHRLTNILSYGLVMAAPRVWVVQKLPKTFFIHFFHFFFIKWITFFGSKTKERTWAITGSPENLPHTNCHIHTNVYFFVVSSLYWESTCRGKFRRQYPYLLFTYQHWKIVIFPTALWLKRMLFECPCNCLSWWILLNCVPLGIRYRPPVTCRSIFFAIHVQRIQK